MKFMEERGRGSVVTAVAVAGYELWSFVPVTCSALDGTREVLEHGVR